MNVHSLEFHSRNQKLKIIQLKKNLKKYKDQRKNTDVQFVYESEFSRILSTD